MRWIWIDRFVEFSSGAHAKSLKCVTMSEDHLHDHFPGLPVMPHSLIIEGLAQTGGILLGEMRGFRSLVVLAKIPKVLFHAYARPGDTLTYSVKLLDSSPDGGIVEGTAMVGDQLIAEIEIVFASITQKEQTDSAQGFVIPTQMLRMLNFGPVSELAPAGVGGS